MKTRAIIWALALFIAPMANGQVSRNFLFRNRFPILNDSLRCDLGPLYVWWAGQMDAKTNTLSATGVVPAESTDATNAVDRPMHPWFHIVGEILNKDEPQGWIVNATVETSPDKGVPMRIILIHPPRKEMAR